MKNPGYIIEVSEEIQFSAHLISLDYIEIYKANVPLENMMNDIEAPSLCLCLYEILDDYKFKILLEDEDYAPIPWGYTMRFLFLFFNLIKNIL